MPILHDVTSLASIASLFMLPVGQGVIFFLHICSILSSEIHLYEISTSTLVLSLTLCANKPLRYPLTQDSDHLPTAAHVSLCCNNVL